MCDNLDGRNGLNAPFCSPSTNTAVQVGRTLEITWDRRFFNRSSSNAIFIQADFGSTAIDSSFGGLDGFTSPPLDPSVGRFTWTILDSFLTSGGTGTVSRGARLFLAQQQGTEVDDDTGLTSTSAVTRITGPRVVLRARDSSTMMMPNPLSIALPVGLGALVVLVIGVWFCFRRWRNRGSNLNIKQNRNMNIDRVRDVEMKQQGTAKKRGFWPRLGMGNSGSSGSDAASEYGIGKSEKRTVTGFGWAFGRKKKGKEEDIEIVHSTHMNAGGGAGPVRMGFVGGGGGNNVFRDEVRRQDRGRLGRGDYL